MSRTQTLGDNKQSLFTALKMQLNFCVLTQLEKQIVQLIAQGLANKEIAKLLHQNPRTFQGYVIEIYRKLGIESNTPRGKRTILTAEYTRCILKQGKHRGY